jgi:hypothetical protein
MMAAAWLAGTDPELMLAILNDRPGRRKQRLFAVACCRLSGRAIQRHPTPPAMWRSGGLCAQAADPKALAPPTHFATVARRGEVGKDWRRPGGTRGAKRLQ